MPQLANIVLTDGAATPVSHTYIPQEISGPVAALAESGSTSLGDQRLTVALRRNNRIDITGKLTLPVTQTVTDSTGRTSTVVARTAYATVDLSYDKSATLQERKDALALLTSLIGNALFKNVANDLQNFY